MVVWHERWCAQFNHRLDGGPHEPKCRHSGQYFLPIDVVLFVCVVGFDAGVCKYLQANGEAQMELAKEASMIEKLSDKAMGK